MGKSVRVRSRLLSYFRSGISCKQSELVRVATGVEWEYVPNEFEAVLREFRQIRAFRPRFNRHHRSERRFAWIRVTGGAAPRLVATRRPVPSPTRHFGPFPAPRSLPRLLRDLSACVGIRDCAQGTPIHFADQTDLFTAARDPGCPRGDLETCVAPCAARCSANEYAERVLEVASFLDGETDAPLIRLRSRMEEAAMNRDFELAARLRDRESNLRELRDEVVLFSEFLASLSFVYRVPSESDDPDRGYVISVGRVVHTFDYAADGQLPTGVRNRVQRVRSRPAQTPDRLGDQAREETFLVARWFRWRPEERSRTTPFETLPAGHDQEGGSNAPSGTSVSTLS